MASSAFRPTYVLSSAVCMQSPCESGSFQHRLHYKGMLNHSRHKIRILRRLRGGTRLIGQRIAANGATLVLLSSICGSRHFGSDRVALAMAPLCVSKSTFLVGVTYGRRRSLISADVEKKKEGCACSLTYLHLDHHVDCTGMSGAVSPNPDGSMALVRATMLPVRLRDSPSAQSVAEKGPWAHGSNRTRRNAGRTRQAIRPLGKCSSYTRIANHWSVIA